MENEQKSDKFDFLVIKKSRNDNLHVTTQHYKKEISDPEYESLFSQIEIQKPIKFIKIDLPLTDFPLSFPHFDQWLNRHYSSLEKLNLILRETNLGPHEASQLISIISKCHHLKTIDLSLRGNPIKEIEIINLLNTLKGLKDLEKLRLGMTDCNLKDDVLTAMNDILNEKQNQLVKLQIHIGANKFTREKIISFIQQVKLCKNLTCLNLYFDNLPIYQDSLLALNDTIVNLKSLKKIYVSILHSHLTISDYYKFAKILQNKENLIKVYLQLRETYTFTDVLLRAFSLISYRVNPFVQEIELGIFNEDLTDFLLQEQELIQVSYLQMIAFQKHISPLLPINSQLVMFDLPDE